MITLPTARRTRSSIDVNGVVAGGSGIRCLEMEQHRTSTESVDGEQLKQRFPLRMKF